MVQHRPEHRSPDDDLGGFAEFALEATPPRDPSLASLEHALDDYAARLGRELPPGAIDRVVSASAVHLPKPAPSLRLIEAAGAQPARNGGRAAGLAGGNGFQRSLRLVLAMAAAVALAFVVATPFGGESQRGASPGVHAVIDDEIADSLFAMPGSSRAESALVALLHDRGAALADSAGSGAFTNLQVFPICSEPACEIASLLDVRQTDAFELAEEFDRIREAALGGDARGRVEL
ncbi:MAG TPA: hypothetical protein PKC43_00765 [Phycisphaerales bacterium]|nr:hypothetical protein [Phycisphaerales bacterium]HMP35957.1 hypothetical protein [Phycisphaerales bacterium]